MQYRVKYQFGQVFDFAQVHDLLEKSKATNALEGGILIGPSHSEGGINVLMRFRDEYRLVLEVEGGEYWLNPLAAQRFIESGDAWNDRERDSSGYEPVTDYSGLQVIDCTLSHPSQRSKFLLVDSRAPLAWVNRYSTARFIHDLEYFNLDRDFYFEGEPDVWSIEWAKRFHGRFDSFRDHQRGTITRR